MILSFSGQARLFASTVAMGFIIGFVYDIFRIFRKVLKHPDLLTQLEDMVYWLIVTFIMFYFMLNKNYGEIRFFSILGALLGMTVYFFSISTFVVKAAVSVIDFIKKVISMIIKIILFPFKILIRIISLPVNLLKSVAIKIAVPAKNILHRIKLYVKIRYRKAKKDLKIITGKV